MLFRDRRDAGERLADQLEVYANREDVVVLAIPRGGVPVAAPVAARLEAPLDVFVVRKLGLPCCPEIALGAIASGGIRVLNYGLLRQLGVPDDALNALETEERVELERRERAYRGDRPPTKIVGRNVILIDDGLATGSSMFAAVRALRRQHPARIVVAVPVGSAEASNELRPEVEELVCLAEPEPFYSVGTWYRNFSQVSDREVQDLLHQAAADAVGSLAHR